MKKESDITIIRKLFALFAKRNKNLIYACLLTDVVESLRPYVVLILSGILIDGFIDGKALHTLLLYTLIGVLVAFVFQFLSAALRKYLNARIENCMERQNQDLNTASLNIDYEYLEDPALQEKKRKQEQVINARGGIYWNLIWPLDRGFGGVISVLTSMIISFPLFFGNKDFQYSIIASPWMGLLLFLLIATTIWGIYASDQYSSKKGHECFEEFNQIKKAHSYIIGNILANSESGKDLRIFGQSKLIMHTLHENDKEAAVCLKKERNYYIQSEILNRFLSNFCLGCVYLYVALNAYAGFISIGNVVLYASSIVKCIDGVSEVLLGISGFKRVAQYGRDYLDYIDFSDRKYKGTLPVEKRRDNRFLIEFDNVSFCYPGTKDYVLRNLSLKLDIGERFAIVGKNGSGKTTFIKLLCRLYDPTDGEIKLNGIDITKYNYDEYLNLFSAVFQDYQMLALKVGENIAASDEVDHDKVYDALNRAGLEERFLETDDNVYIGKEYDESGVNFSGGEKQKMAIARAIYKDAPFVIMDEPTAALDPESECEVYAGFNKMVGNKTALYISHRLASCRFCQDILVFDNGQVIQRGSHEELIEQDGLYQKLWNAQAQYYT
ncbi:MAG: ABC transporter ATP-binding protein [Lachnospiraceae bacterium]|nr:ABC transporter ATP-binding protein [Lachnospiraceae bacterium]